MSGTIIQLIDRTALTPVEIGGAVLHLKAMTNGERMQFNLEIMDAQPNIVDGQIDPASLADAGSSYDAVLTKAAAVIDHVEFQGTTWRRHSDQTATTTPECFLLSITDMAIQKEVVRAIMAHCKLSSEQEKN